MTYLRIHMISDITRPNYKLVKYLKELFKQLKWTKIEKQHCSKTKQQKHLMNNT